MIRIKIVTTILSLLMILSFRTLAMAGTPDTDKSPIEQTEEQYFQRIEKIIKDNPKISEETKSVLYQLVQELVKKQISGREIEIITNRILAKETHHQLLQPFYEIILAAHQKEVPLSSVFDKIKEGLAKNVAPRMLESTVHLVSERLSFAKELVDSMIKKGIKVSTAQERLKSIEVLSESLWRDVTKEALHEMITYFSKSKQFPEMNPNDLNAGVLCLADLVAVQIPIKTSQELIQIAFDQSYQAADFSELSSIVKPAKKLKVLTSEKITAMLKSGLEKGWSPSQLSKIIEKERLEEEVKVSEKAVEEAREKMKQGVENAREQLEKAKERLERAREQLERAKEQRRGK
ncbi:MAG: hypothetical protein V1709_06810 [Planctomycetota bacterium]